MRTSERHHLKDNELALAVGHAQQWLADNRASVTTAAVAIVLVGGGVLGYLGWRQSVDSRAAALLAEAMVVDEAQVAPPLPPAGTTNDPNALGGQQPGTYPTLQAKLEAALPRFLAAADAYPGHPAGQTARLHAAETLARLGRTDEAIRQYDMLVGGGNALLARAARLGRASVQLRAGQYDPAIATLKELADQKDGPLPSDALLMELARAYVMAGRIDDARKTLAQVVEQHAESPYVTDAKAEIAKLKS
jgi:predicted negative regulator of RcsB-dependent stress response